MATGIMDDEDAGLNPAEKKKQMLAERRSRCRIQSGGKEERGMDDIRRNEHTNMPAYNDGEMDEEKDEEKDE